MSISATFHFHEERTLTGSVDAVPPADRPEEPLVLHLAQPEHDVEDILLLARLHEVVDEVLRGVGR